MSIDFVAIDFETATKQYSSACAVGIAIVEQMKVKQTFYTLLNPGLSEFDAENIEIHGINPEDVIGAPSLDKFLIQFSDLFGKVAIVAHNAYFDMNVLRCSCYTSKYFDDFKYIDSVSIARDYVPGQKDLASCANYFGIDMGKHHNAEDDAITCAKIIIECIAQSNASNFGEFCFSHPNVKIHHFSDLMDNTQNSMPTKVSRQRHFDTIRPSDVSCTVDNVDWDGPLYGKNIVFTGNLSIDRRDAMQLAVNAGAVVKSSVSKKTDYLVVGEQDLSLVGDDGMSTKEERAYALITSGQADIKIIKEDDYLSLVEEAGSISS